MLYNIAIDGPAGAGKSTIAKNIAIKLGIIYLDTGAMYRAIGLKTDKIGINYLQKEAIIDVLNSTMIDIIYQNGNQRVILDGKDVSDEIREHHISKIASEVSSLKEVREKLVELQRKIAFSNSSVLDGRDIGTFVLPNAKYKFYLIASLDERSKRRYNELKEKGVATDYETVTKDIIQRDFNDSNREFAPLKKADDAIEIDTTSLSIEQVTNKILSYIK